eukprot:2539643-Amphidinium_carterae.1
MPAVAGLSSIGMSASSSPVGSVASVGADSLPNVGSFCIVDSSKQAEGTFRKTYQNPAQSHKKVEC